MRVNDVSSLSPETRALMEQLVEALREDQGTAPVLSADELTLIRAKVAGGSFDELDAGALLDHIDYLADAYEQLVQRGGEEADRGQALVLAKEEELQDAESMAVDAKALFDALGIPQEIRDEHYSSNPEEWIEWTVRGHITEQVNAVAAIAARSIR